MQGLLTWLQGSPLGELMRSLGVWTYGVVNLVHILSVATLFGAVLMLDLRLLGAWRRVPIAALERPAIMLAIVGFVLIQTLDTVTRSEAYQADRTQSLDSMRLVLNTMTKELRQATAVDDATSTASHISFTTYVHGASRRVQYDAKGLKG